VDGSPRARRFASRCRDKEPKHEGHKGNEGSSQAKVIMSNTKLILKLVFGVFLVLTTCIVGLLLWSNRYIFDPKPPERLFNLEDLLITQDVIPHWKAADSFFPAGDNLCTTECLARDFGTKEDYPGALATQYIFRYRTSGIAQRTFGYEYETKDEIYLSVSNWNNQSSNAQQSFFGCGYMAGQVRQVCLWAGRYDEYIVEFIADIIPGEMEISDIIEIVKAIDTRVTSYLLPR
jgi:hypothetical protein